MKTKAPIPYFGSDASVADRIAAHFDDCKHVTILFAGGMSILPHLKASHIVANDLNGAAINFYQVLSGVHGTAARDQLIEFCNGTLSHPTVLAQATKLLDDHMGATAPILAWAYWAQCWIARKGSAGTGRKPGDPSVRWAAVGGNNASRLSAAKEDLTAWAEHFKRCEWIKRDFRRVIPNIKHRKDCGVYVDPPWFGAGDAYEHTFTHTDHVELQRELRKIKNAKVFVRYGDHPSVLELYNKKFWNIERATSRTQANSFIGELWITKKQAK